MKTVLCFLLACALAASIVTGVAIASADAVAVEPFAGDAGVASATAAGSGSAVTTTTTTTTTTVAPADQIADPLVDPVKALDQVKTAKAAGWGVVFLVVLIIICRLLGRLGGMFKRLAEGKVAVVIASVGTLAITSYNALILEGSWFAALLAAVVSGAALWDAHAKPKAKTEPTAEPARA